MFCAQGILDDPESSCPNFADHNMLVTGYGTNSHHQDYWIVKNSWGTEWGHNGYAYIPRTTEYGRGFCNILSISPLYPVVDPTYTCRKGGGLTCDKGAWESSI